jgi:hypothetical protein
VVVLLVAGHVLLVRLRGVVPPFDPPDTDSPGTAVAGADRPEVVVDAAPGATRP